MTSLLLKDRTKLIVTLLQWTRSGISYLSVNKNWYTCTVFVLISLFMYRTSKGQLISECNHCTSICIDDL